MSILMDGINNAYSLTGQINGLQSLSQQDMDDPAMIKYALAKNFNQMLEKLISSTDDEDDGDNENDYFSFLTSSNQASLQSLQAQGILENPSIINSMPDMSSPEYLNSLYNLGQLR